jgi:hypothetical protein
MEDYNLIYNLQIINKSNHAAGRLLWIRDEPRIIEYKLDIDRICGEDIRSSCKNGRFNTKPDQYIILPFNGSSFYSSSSVFFIRLNKCRAY